MEFGPYCKASDLTLDNDECDKHELSVNRQLMNRALNALVHDHTDELPVTSLFDQPMTTTPVEVFYEWLTDKEENAAAVLKVLALVEQGKGDTAEARLLTQAAISTCAKKYADFWSGPVACLPMPYAGWDPAGALRKLTIRTESKG